MRLPWLQVDQDGINRCRLLARLLGIPETQGIGLGMTLWQWALEIAPDSDFRGHVPDPALLAAALAWPIDDSKRLITELQRVGMVATEPALRVRGLERYRRTWEKNRRNGGKSADSGDGLPGPGENPPRPAPVPARQTHTHTQKKTQNNQLPLSAEKPADRAAVVFEHWRRVMGKNARTAFDKKRRDAVEGRLRDGYAIEDLCRAVDGCALTPHNMGKNDRGTRFDDLELICRDAAHVDRFRATADSAGPPQRERPDIEDLREVVRLAQPLGAYLVSQLEQFQWARGDSGFIGAHDDGFFARWLDERHGAELAPLGITIAGPAQEGAPA